MEAMRPGCKQISNLAGARTAINSAVSLSPNWTRSDAYRSVTSCSRSRQENARESTMNEIRSAASAILKACAVTSVLLLGPAAIATSPTAPTAPASFPISDASFKCITEMTHVRHFYVDNLAGNLAGTVKVAQAATGDYPVGSVLQLVPTEVMVKRDKGFNAATRDWEFFELNISPTSSMIRVRGVQDVNNRFGGNCFTCHVKAQPQFDLVCDNNHGCDGIPITRAMSGALQRTDPRCKNPPVSAEDAAALGQLGAIVKALAAAKAAGSAPEPAGAPKP